ncbi:MAG TPA: aminoglycoside phosphotransferase family protein, partial [Bacteroidales bacterium]|nr:aminoglycoside phosphotransferase family protein [Bacteroidales bacterium]
MNELLPILQSFVPHTEVSEILPLGSGHIHSTYLAKTNVKPDIVLQQINTRVFRDPAAVTNNISIVTRHIREKLNAQGIKDTLNLVLTPLQQTDGSFMYTDSGKKVWRCFYFIAGRTYDQAISESQVFEGGKAYGKFLNMLSDLSPEPIKETIKGFHNMALRIRQFDDARKNGMAERISESSTEIEILNSRRDEMMVIQNLGKECHIPVRIVHHDTKINNVLFDEKGKGLCVIDLDTVMPGYVHDDFGDSIRTFTNTGEEDDTDLTKVSINMDYFKAYSEGYLEETRLILNPVEKEYLALSARAMTYMQCLRFLTDHLNGDIYYHISHEGHNLQRTKAQIRLLLSMEENSQKM